MNGRASSDISCANQAFCLRGLRDPYKEIFDLLSAIRNESDTCRDARPSSPEVQGVNVSWEGRLEHEVRECNRRNASSTLRLCQANFTLPAEAEANRPKYRQATRGSDSDRGQSHRSKIYRWNVGERDRERHADKRTDPADHATMPHGVYG